MNTERFRQGMRWGIVAWTTLAIFAAYHENWRWFAVGAIGMVSWFGSLITDILENR